MVDRMQALQDIPGRANWLAAAAQHDLKSCDQKVCDSAACVVAHPCEGDACDCVRRSIRTKAAGGGPRAHGFLDVAISSSFVLTFNVLAVVDPACPVLRVALHRVSEEPDAGVQS